MTDIDPKLHIAWVPTSTDAADPDATDTGATKEKPTGDDSASPDAKDTKPDAMPARGIPVTYRVKITDTTAHLETLPEVGDPKKFPDVVVGTVTPIVKQRDNNDNLIAINTVPERSTPCTTSTRTA